MSLIAIVLVIWTVVSVVALRLMMVVGRASEVADRQEEQAAGEALFTRGVRLVVADPQRFASEALCPACSVLVRGALPEEACPACGTAMIALPRIGEPPASIRSPSVTPQVQKVERTTRVRG